MALLVEAAQALNTRIADTGVLGERYEVGHTYFFDIIPLLEWQMPPKRASTAQHFLWHGNQPDDALRNLWDLAIRPLLAEYLAGLDAQEAEQALRRLEESFLTKPSAA